MNEELKKYEVTPEPVWGILQMRGAGGYDCAERVASKKWHVIPSWGRDGWDLGSWPYVMVFFRSREGCYEVIEYVEGDVTAYQCPTKELRSAITDEIAFFHWKHREEEWVKNYESVDQLPENMRGPYRP